MYEKVIYTNIIMKYTLYVYTLLVLDFICVCPCRYRGLSNIHTSPHPNIRTVLHSSAPIDTLQFVFGPQCQDALLDQLDFTSTSSSRISHLMSSFTSISLQWSPFLGPLLFHEHSSRSRKLSSLVQQHIETPPRSAWAHGIITALCAGPPFKERDLFLENHAQPGSYGESNAILNLMHWWLRTP